LEFGYQEMPGGDVLILAGDICEYRTLKKEFQKSQDAREIAKSKLKSYDFFYKECAKYKKVFYVMGNHEHYHHRFNKTYDDLKMILPDNVTLLENEMEEYNGILFLGATLWTDFNKGDPITVYTISDFMNDYRVIQNFYPLRSQYHNLTPDHILSTHRESRKYFKTILELNRDKPIVVITHMAPSFLSVNEKYKNDSVNNGAYASDLNDMILDNENIKVWIHGHMHDPVDYMIGNTRVISNPRGYLPYEGNNGFIPNFSVEV